MLICKIGVYECIIVLGADSLGPSSLLRQPREDWGGGRKDSSNSLAARAILLRLTKKESFLTAYGADAMSTQIDYKCVLVPLLLKIK